MGITKAFVRNPIVNENKYYGILVCLNPVVRYHQLPRQNLQYCDCHEMDNHLVHWWALKMVGKFEDTSPTTPVFFNSFFHVTFKSFPPSNNVLGKQ
jgi:hypothetical protein